MSLHCDTGDYEDYEWWWRLSPDESVLSTKRSRKCCSCGLKIHVGDTARQVSRFRPPTEFEETKGIAGEGDEVYMASWYLCETCGDLADSISELGFSFSLGDGDSLKQQIADYKNN